VSAADVGRASRLVSRRTGVIAAVHAQERAADEPALHFFWSIAPPHSPWGPWRADCHGTGASVDRDRAFMKAVGESVERYGAAAHATDALPVRAFAELDAPAVAPETWTLFSELQYAQPSFPFEPFGAHTRVRWVPGRSLARGTEVLVPAAFVFLPYDRGTPPAFREPPITQPVSTGLSCASTRLAATYRGLLEVVERDAYMLVWHHRLERPAIHLRPGTPLVGRLLGALARTAISCRAVLLTLDLPVPVVLVVLSTQTGVAPLTVVGLGADGDPWLALALALEEACMAFAGLRRALRAAPPPRGAREPTSLEARARAWAVDPALREEIAFLTEGEPSLDLDDVPKLAGASTPEALGALVDHLAGAGHDAVAVDLTPPDIDEVGFKVVRVLVPGLQPLDLDHATRHLGGRRLREVPPKLGLAPAAEPNPVPHPLS
jgi:ribosomal protein S12 methylthiotransferase accessory factor